MDIQKMQNEVEKELSKKRYEHTLRVINTAEKLAQRYSQPVEKVIVAGLLHDYAKCKSEDDLQYEIKKYHLPNHLLDFDKELWHAPVGAKIAAEKFQVSDPDILHAIRYHTTGRENMSPIELITFVADYIEPARNFPGVEEVRELALENLELAARKALKNTIGFLLSKDVLIYPDTIFAYNDLTRKTGGFSL